MDYYNKNNKKANKKVNDVADIYCRNGKTIVKKEERKLKKMYLKVIKNFKKLLVELELTEPLEVYYAFYHMYMNGFLSYERCFTYYNDESDFYFMPGLHVINGHGVCRHISSMLHDIYKEFGYNSKIILVYSDVKKVGKKYKLCNKDFGIRGIKQHFLGDHAIVYVKKDKTKYILDPTNFILLKPGDKNKIMENILCEGEYMKYVPSNISSCRKLTRGTYKDADECTLSYSKVCQRLGCNEYKLEKFYYDNEKTYEKIANKVDNSLYGRIIKMN